MISYAQNFEDVILNRAFGGKADGFYVDIGAWHPVVDSVTKHFYDLGWSGINVEPASEPFRALHSARPRDINLNLAIGDRRETREFYEVANSGLSTFRDDLLADLPAYGFHHTVRSIEVSTLGGLCQTHVDGPIDFMKIDVEGWEEAVIRGGDWKTFRPAIVVIEAVLAYPGVFCSPVQPSSSKSVEPFVVRNSFRESFVDKGYDLSYFDGLNEFYVAREFRHLRDLISVPPNVFDRFLQYRAHEAERRVQEITDRSQDLERQLEACRNELARRS